MPQWFVKRTTAQGGLLKLYATREPPLLGGFFMFVPSNTVQVRTNLSLLPVKGGGLCVAKLGGIVCRYFYFAKNSYRRLYNPSVAIATAPFAQGEPFIFCAVWK